MKSFLRKALNLNLHQHDMNAILKQEQNASNFMDIIAKFAVEILKETMEKWGKVLFTFIT